jgi:hypothetical protein
MRIALIVLGCMLATWAVARSLPVFDVARFDQVVFGGQIQADQALPAIPVSLLPTWALLLLATVFWGVAIALKLVSSKELKS